MRRNSAAERSGCPRTPESWPPRKSIAKSVVEEASKKRFDRRPDPGANVPIVEAAEGGNGDIYSVLHSAGALLAARFASACGVSDCVADLATVPHSGDRGRRCLGIVARNFVLARARIARAATHVDSCYPTDMMQSTLRAINNPPV